MTYKICHMEYDIWFRHLASAAADKMHELKPVS
jgi:hypothetical protein